MLAGFIIGWDKGAFRTMTTCSNTSFSFFSMRLLGTILLISNLSLHGKSVVTDSNGYILES